MEAFRHLSALIERPIQNVSNDDIASLSHRHLVEFCFAKGIGSGVDGANGIGNYSEEELRARIAAFRDGIATTNADTTTKTDEFDDDDDDDFASFDIEAAIQSASSPATTAFKVETPSKRPHASQQDDQSSAEKRCKTTSSPLASETTSSHTDIDIETMEQAIPPDFASQMKSSLLTHFGHTTFRPGQLLLLHSILHNRDACAFWATGAGKSLTYQLPPLHLQQVGVIITPLVSLMQDQCAKLNTLVRSSGGGGEVATYLGSAQTDASMEERALRGEFRLVYVTPEKLVGGNFLERLARMHRQGRGKCGHDFRPEFLKIGSSLRTHPILSSIPILALTATAVPRVQRDILTNLHMHPSEATIVKKSFDRPNLKIVIRRKPKNGPMAALDAVVKELAKGEGKMARSTIVYCATRREVEEIAALLANSLSHLLEKERGISWDKATAVANLLVKPYHAALSISDRTDSHLSFLVGKTAVIVATVAFGMGIDKPDIRRVIHWGPPKTVEEYYQQMGRASRDGLFGECILYCDMNDFTKYKGGFYLDKLRGEAKEATIKSMDALRDFCMKEDVCRRSALMGFFEEVPSFGKWCGTCDVCLFREANRDDLERDFSLDGAKVLLLAVTLLKNQSWTSIEKVISGGKVESYKYSPTSVYSTRDLEFEKKRMKKKRSVAFLKELIPTMIDRGF
ncbi:hypothetical protein HJC23_009203 [Cyclotella cryptica]|uniref:ATP-dependent DNA helicase n=1 Tax=Cyclotella cryptica TaxID=29204 RepID=A0ABD3NUV3_9STRA|eukprot:CCRYP_019759-RA/>CCRYP_019759-RA protein AED:0.06 eAED:0.06 QI:0/0.75/0.8/1/0.75/0.8/5/1867/683